MARIIFFLLLLIPFFIFGKETKKITTTHILTPFKEIFYVLKSDTSIRQGSYNLLSNGKLLIQGFYKMGRKDSVWTQQNMEGKLRFRGFYSQNQRVGIWEFYNNNEELEQKIDFTKNEILYYRTQFLNHSFRVISGSDTMLTVLDRPPLFLGGSSRLNEYIASTIAPPLHKPEEKTVGTVYVEFSIDSTGRASNHRILKGIGAGCNREALRVVKLIPDEWLPGVLKGKHVDVDYVIPILFNKNDILSETLLDFLWDK